MSETLVSTPKEIAAQCQQSDSESDTDPDLSARHPLLVEYTRCNLDGAVVRELRTKASDETEECEDHSSDCSQCGDNQLQTCPAA